MSQLRPPGSPSRGGQRPSGSSSPFAKALLEAGGSVAGGVAEQSIQLGADMLTSLLGAGDLSSGINQTPQTSNGSLPSGQNSWDAADTDATASQHSAFPFGTEQSLSPEAAEKEWQQREARLLRHREVQRMDVYDADQIKRDQRMKQILDELQALAKDLDAVNKEAGIAVMQGVVGKTGEYHITFFEKLLKTIVLLRQRVKESASWLNQFQTRKARKGDYWGNVNQNGTSWAMSSERAIATSVG